MRCPRNQVLTGGFEQQTEMRGRSSDPQPSAIWPRLASGYDACQEPDGPPGLDYLNAQTLKIAALEMNTERRSSRRTALRTCADEEHREYGCDKPAHDHLFSLDARYGRSVPHHATSAEGNRTGGDPGSRNAQ